MFANFLYFIIALMILALYQPAESLSMPAIEAIVWACVTAGLFAALCRLQFKRLAHQTSGRDLGYLDHHFSQLITRHSILALAFFAINVWGLHLPAYLSRIPLMRTLPTLAEIILLGLFVGYLLIVWTFAYDAHCRIYPTDMSRRTYIYSNAIFSLPILLPWALLWGIADLIKLMPFEQFKQVLNTPMGQAGYFMIFLIFAALFAPLLIQRFWGCHPLEAGQQRDRIVDLCSRAGVGYKDIVYWPVFGGRIVTAGVMGLFARFRYILVTKALLQLLHPDEIDQVIAHEIGHVRRKHLLFYLLFFVGFMLITYGAYRISIYLVFSVQPVSYLTAMFKLKPFDVIAVFNAILVLISIILYFRFVFGYFMRNFERQADLHVFRLFPSAEPLISTFDKIVLSSGQPADKPNWHHFSIQQRINYLKKCEQDRHWIDQHDRKVRNSLATFVIAFVLMAAALLHFNQTMIVQGIRVADIEHYLEQKTEKHPDDAILYELLGNVYYERQEMEKTAAAYESALAITPNNADVLNNLAWLLVESQGELRNPQRALQLAQKAIALKKAPHIYDTLAESLFANGRVTEAIIAEENALAMNPENRKYYQDQLVKFKSAADR